MQKKRRESRRKKKGRAKVFRVGLDASTGQSGVLDGKDRGDIAQKGQ